MLRIGDGTPSTIAVQANAQALGRYAAAWQEAGLVPVVTPEVSMGGAHSAVQCETVSSIVLFAVITELQDNGVGSMA